MREEEIGNGKEELERDSRHINKSPPKSNEHFESEEYPQIGRHLEVNGFVCGF